MTGGADCRMLGVPPPKSRFEAVIYLHIGGGKAAVSGLDEKRAHWKRGTIQHRKSTLHSASRLLSE